jgi:small redox-active disulfide protein 2
VRKVRIGNFVVGLTGLDEVFATAARDARAPGDAALGSALVAALRAEGNYIPQNESALYAEALVHHYGDFLAAQKIAGGESAPASGRDTMKIEILGPGCARCRATEENVRKALAETHTAAEVVHVTDVLQFAKRGVMLTPGVLIDGAVRSSGRVPTVEEIKQWLQPAPAAR